MQDGRRSTLTLAAFAAPCLPLAAFGLPLVITLPHFYSEVLGLSGAAVGLAFLVVRLIDIAFDPVFGVILDRTNTRWGRFKFWFALGAPLVMLGVYLLFYAQPGVTPLYLWASLIIVYAGYSMTVLSHTAWAATLSAAYHERSRVYAFWQSGNVVGMILVLALPVVLSLTKVVTDESGRAQSQGLFVLLLMPLMLALALWRVDEPRKTAEQAAEGPKATIGDYFRLISRPTVVRILSADLLMGLAPGIAGTLFLFYFTRVKGFDQTTAFSLLFFYFIMAIGGAPVWTYLGKRYGKARSLVISCIVYAIVQFAVVTLPAANPDEKLMSFLIALPFVAAAGLPYSAAPFLVRAMMADYADEERLESGADRTGLLFAILTGTVKVGSALAVSTMIVLAFLGFSAENPAASTAGGMQALQAFYAFAPGIVGLLAACCMIGYPLTEERHAEIRAKLSERDAAVTPVVPEDVSVLEPNVAQSPAG